MAQGYKNNKEFVLNLKNNIKRYDKSEVIVREDLLRIADEINEGNIQMGEKIIVSINTKIVYKGKLIVSYDYIRQFIR